MNGTSSDIVIVGGSLAGLTLALACAAGGVPVSVVERAIGGARGGDSLSVDLALVASATGHDPRSHPALPVVPGYRELTTWAALHAWLRGRVAETSGIALETGRTVAAVEILDEGAKVGFADGTRRTAAAVIGADGYRSVVRRSIVPHQPYARYAGYLVWRGLVEERLLERPVPWPSDGGLWIEFVDGYRLVGAALPGRDGSVRAGERQITFAWFDAHREALLRRTGCLNADGEIVGTLGRETIDASIREELAGLAPRYWPEAWAEAVVAGVRSPDVLSGAPIAEYRASRLARGPLAIVGDAAHVVSPMTGRGYLTGVEDAIVLARLLADSPTHEPLSAALERYEAARLPLVRALVARSESISADYRHHASEAWRGMGSR